MFLDQIDILQISIQPNGKLQISNRIITDSISFSHQKRSKEKMDKTPGPGDYNIRDDLIKSSRITKFIKPSRNNAISYRVSTGPNPTSYNVIQEFTKNSGPKFSFGKGKKSIHLNKSTEPGPGTYDKKPIIGTEGRKQKFTGQRTPIKPECGRDSPGPGKYDQPLHKTSVSFSMGKPKEKQKIGILKEDSKAETWVSPGPGEYNPQNSIHQSDSPSWKFHPSTKTDKTIKNDMPDPGTYNLPDTIGKGPKIGFHGFRTERKIDKLPGPGEYDPSMKILEKNCSGVPCLLLPSA